MTVKELIEILKETPQDATVLLFDGESVEEVVNEAPDIIRLV